jgi:hypothetical protein
MVLQDPPVLMGLQVLLELLAHKARKAFKAPLAHKVLLALASTLEVCGLLVLRIILKITYMLKVQIFPG